MQQYKAAGEPAKNIRTKTFVQNICIFWMRWDVPNPWRCPEISSDGSDSNGSTHGVKLYVSLELNVTNFL